LKEDEDEEEEEEEEEEEMPRVVVVIVGEDASLATLSELPKNDKHIRNKMHILTKMSKMSKFLQSLKQLFNTTVLQYDEKMFKRFINKFKFSSQFVMEYITRVCLH